MLEGTNITVRKGGKVLLDDVSIRVPAGQVTVILGPNGAGKTTLVRALLGDERLVTGEVRYAGRPLCDWPSAQLARRIGFLQQSQNLQFPFSVREVVLMGRSNRYRFLERPEDLAAADSALAQVGLEPFAQRDFTTLSGGEKQRVSLARILCQLGIADESADDADIDEPSEEFQDAPRFLVLDEPNNNLDIRHQLGVLEIAQNLSHRGIGILAILHDLSQAAAIADQVVLMKDARIHSIGAPEILEEAAILDVFGVALTHGVLQKFPFRQVS